MAGLRSRYIELGQHCGRSDEGLAHGDENPMHWLAAAAARAGMKGADVLVLPGDISLLDSWEIASRTLGVSAPQLAR